MNPFSMPTVFDRFAHYLSKDQNKKPSTVSNYIHQIKQVYLTLNGDILSISEYNKMHDLIIKTGERLKWDRNTLYKCFVCSRRFFVWAVHRERIISNFPWLPGAPGFDYKKKPKQEAYFLPQEKSRKLWANPFNTLRDTAMILLFEGTALRKAELQNLNIEDIDTRSGARTVHVKNGKRDGFRHIPIPKGHSTLLRFYIYTLHTAGFNDKNPLFPAPDGRRLSKSRIHRVVKNRGDKEGFRAYPHALRHGSLTSMVERDIPLPVVQRIAGHANQSQTSEYLHLSSEFLKAKIDASSGKAVK